MCALLGYTHVIYSFNTFSFLFFFFITSPRLIHRRRISDANDKLAVSGRNVGFLMEDLDQSDQTRGNQRLKGGSVIASFAIFQENLPPFILRVFLLLPGKRRIAIADFEWFLGWIGKYFATRRLHEI